MTPRRRRSRKHSAASSSAKRLESAVFYLDESIYSKVLAEALVLAGAQVRRPGADVPFGTPDEEWLRKAGAERWIVLMRDQRVRHRPSELKALQSARAGGFVITAGQATAQHTAQIVLQKLSRMVNIATSEPRPFLYTLGQRGSLSRMKLPAGGRLPGK